MTVGEKLCKTCGNNKNYGDAWHVDCKKNCEGLYWEYIDGLHRGRCKDRICKQLTIADMEMSQDGSSKKDGKKYVYSLH